VLYINRWLQFSCCCPLFAGCTAETIDKS